jgi:hypothetical protein
MVWNSMNSLAVGGTDAASARFTAAELEPVLTTETLNVANVAVGTMYTVALVFAVGLACPRIPVGIFFP